MIQGYGALPINFSWAIKDIGEKCQTEWAALIRCSSPKKYNILRISFESAIQNLKTAYKHLDPMQKKSLRKYVCSLASTMKSSLSSKNLTPVINCVIAINKIQFSREKEPALSLRMDMSPDVPTGASKAPDIQSLTIKIPSKPFYGAGAPSCMGIDAEDPKPKDSKPVTPTALKELPFVKDLQFPHKLLMGLLESKNWEPALESALQLPLDDSIRINALVKIINASKTERPANKEEDIILKKTTILAIRGLYTKIAPDEFIKKFVSTWTKADLKSVIQKLHADNNLIRHAIACQLETLMDLCQKDALEEHKYLYEESKT